MSEIRFEQATRIYKGTDKPAVDALELLVHDGEFMVLVGPSGSGKSTALRMIAGLEEVDSGGIWIGDRDVTWERPQDRDVAMVFQNYALYPFLNVEDNIGFPLKMSGVDKDERRRRVREAAELLELDMLLERKPGQLSGGQRQRVAMGRAIVREPSAFLMDEPLSNLDALLRGQMRAEIAQLQGRLGVTTVYVTHDQVEAMTMGTRVAVLRDGQLQQCAPPRVLYEQPGERVRRRLHRLAADEPARARGPRRRRRARRAADRAAACRGGERGCSRDARHPARGRHARSRRRDRSARDEHRASRRECERHLRGCRERRA